MVVISIGMSVKTVGEKSSVMPSAPLYANTIATHLLIESYNSIKREICFGQLFCLQCAFWSWTQPREDLLMYTDLSWERFSRSHANLHALFWKAGEDQLVLSAKTLCLMSLSKFDSVWFRVIYSQLTTEFTCTFRTWGFGIFFQCSWKSGLLSFWFFFFQYGERVN